MNRIIVPLDRSPMSERALPVAQAVARHEHASLELVTVATAGEQARAATYLEWLSGLVTGVDVSTLVVEADLGESVAERLAQVSDGDPDTLVCMSTHGRTSLGAAVLGSTAEDLLRGADAPVLLVSRDCALPWPGHRRSLLIPLDGPGGEGILEPAINIARRSRFEPVLLHVSHPHDPDDPDLAGKWLDVARRRMVDDGLAAKVDHVVGANPAKAIDEAALTWGAALIVMASYVRPGAARAFLGSSTIAAIHGAPCPVLVYPGRTLMDPRLA